MLLQREESNQQRADTGALAKMASESQQCHGDKKKKKKATLERSLGMNYVADQPVTAFFLGGIYSEGSDRSYLKAKCYEFSPTDKKTKRSSCVSQSGGARGIYQWNELAPDLAPDNCHINRALGEGSHFLPLPPTPSSLWLHSSIILLPPLSLSSSSTRLNLS